jgi:hypothetical protein
LKEAAIAVSALRSRQHLRRWLLSLLDLGRFGGGLVSAWANAPVEYFRVTRGNTSRFASSKNWERYFCPRCGCGLSGKYREPPQEVPNLVWFGIFNLDTPEAIQPTAHIWCSSKVPYFDVSDDLTNIRFPEGTLTHSDKRKPWHAV